MQVAKHVAAALALPLLIGCVKRLPMEEISGADPKQPHAVILYSGVRDGARRYADYSSIDRTILVDK